MIDRDTINSLALECGAAEFYPARQSEPAFTDKEKKVPQNYLVGYGFLECFAQLVTQKAVEDERKKNQADIELWKAEAAKAELWRGRCLSMDHGDGRTVQQIQAEAVAIEREACARINSEKSHRLAQEAEQAAEEGDHDTCASNQAAAFLLSVCAARIRARGTGGAG